MKPSDLVKLLTQRPPVDPGTPEDWEALAAINAGNFNFDPAKKEVAPPQGMLDDTISRAFKQANDLGPAELATALYEQGKAGLGFMKDAVEGKVDPSPQANAGEAVKRMFDLSSLAPIASLPASAVEGATLNSNKLLAPKFNPEIAKTLNVSDGPISMNTTNNKFGARHMEERHADQVKPYSSTEELAKDVANSFSQVRQAGPNRLLVSKPKGSKRQAGIILQPTADGWKLISGGMWNNKYLDRKTRLYANKDRALAVALMDVEGKLIEGKPGQFHPDLYKQHLGKDIDELPAEAFDGFEEGFTIPGSKEFKSREEAAQWVKYNEPELYARLGDPEDGQSPAASLESWSYDRAGRSDKPDSLFANKEEGAVPGLMKLGPSYNELSPEQKAYFKDEADYMNWVVKNSDMAKAFSDASDKISPKIKTKEELIDQGWDELSDLEVLVDDLGYTKTFAGKLDELVQFLEQGNAPDNKWKARLQELEDQIHDHDYSLNYGDDFLDEDDLYRTPESRMATLPKAPEGNVRLYHATNSQKGAPVNWPQEGKFNLDRASKTEPGVFMTPDPWLAENFGDTFVPIDFDPTNSLTVDGAAMYPQTGYASYDPAKLAQIIMGAKQMGKDSVIFKNMEDMGHVADQYIALNPVGRVKSALTGETLFAKGMPTPTELARILQEQSNE